MRDSRSATRLDCWDFFECGHGPSGPGTRCRVATEAVLDGFNGGWNGGRACWAVSGTLGVDPPECTANDCCSSCEFRRQVARLEMPDFADTGVILERLGYQDTLRYVMRPEPRSAIDFEIGCDAK